MKWFYAENIRIEDEEAELSEEIDTEPRVNPNWSMRPNGDKMVQVEELLNILARVNINGVECAQNFVGRRIQPCKKREKTAYEYYHLEDFAREAPEPLSNEEIDRRVAKLFTLKKEAQKEKRHPQQAYGVMNPPPQVTLLSNLFMYLLYEVCTLDVFDRMLHRTGGLLFQRFRTIHGPSGIS